MQAHTERYQQRLCDYGYGNHVEEDYVWYDSQSKSTTKRMGRVQRLPLMRLVDYLTH